MSLKYKFILFLTITQVAIFLILTLTFGFMISSVKNSPQDKRISEQSKTLKRELSNKNRNLQYFIELIKALEITSSQSLDKSSLKLLTPEISKLMTTYSIDILEIGDNRGRVKYRFHRSDEFGDDKSYQEIIKEALAGKDSSAIEVGSSGLALRRVQLLPYGDTIMAGFLINRKFLSDLCADNLINLAISQEDSLIASSDDVVEEFFKQNKDKIKFNQRIKFKDRNYYSTLITGLDNGLGTMKLNYLILLDETELAAAVRNLWISLILVSIIAFIVISSFTVYFGRDIISSFRILVRSMRKMEGDDKELHDLSLRRKDEIGQMAGIFLGVKSDLRTYQDHLVDLVELKTNEIEIKNIELNNANKALDLKQKIIDHEIMIAKNLQEHLLPDMSNLLKITDTYISYEPASGVSGDIFDFGMISGKEAYFFLADVSGHGVPASLVTAMLKISFSKIQISETSPGEALKQLNRDLVDILDDHYFTAILCKIDYDKKIISYANAGATPGVLIKKRKKRIKLLKPTGSVMGVFSELDVLEFTEKIESGDKLFLFTDGISEEQNRFKEFFGTRRIARVLLDSMEYSNQDSLKILLSKVNNFSGRENYNDDLTAILTTIA